MLLMLSADFFKIGFFQKNSFRKTITVLNRLVPDHARQNLNNLDPDQARHSIGPDLEPICLQRLSADNKSHHHQGDLKPFFSLWFK